MSSDRVVVSPVGRKWAAPETSGFSQTCNLLSQFLRGKGSLKEVSPQIATQLETKEYNHKKEIKLDNVPKVLIQEEEEEEEEDNPQMTIFYAGKVTVLNNLLPDQANHLLITFAAAATHQQLPPDQPPAAGGDLPIARRASLHRFLDKRKARVMAKAPYTASSSKGF